MKKQSITRYYATLQDDFFPANDYALPEDYRWVRRDVGSRLLSAVIYGLALAFSTVYCRLFLHLRIRGARKLRQTKGGCFLYGNHTQPVGDVFTPALVCFPKRIYTVVSPANYGLPVIGRILPFLGALPLADTVSGARQLHGAMETRLAAGSPVVIYPEAHVWEYYTGIRPFGAAAFKYPEMFGVPAFAMTAVYRRRRFGRRPRLELYVDGPFAAAGETKKARAEDLRRQVEACMVQRSHLSDCEYIRYRPAPAADRPDTSDKDAE